MLRRILSLVAAFLFTSSVVAMAQIQGGIVSPQTTDCSSPANSFLPECAGSRPLFPIQVSHNTGHHQARNVWRRHPVATSLPDGWNGINQKIPTYDDQAPNARQSGLRYSPYLGMERKQPLTEFQQVVAGSVGQVLPIFGANLFSNVAADLAPIDRTPVTADYVVGTGDQLLIRVWGQVNFNVHATVDRSGDIYIPQVGNIEVAGLHFQQLDGFLRNQLGRVFRNFDLSVNMGQLRSIQIYVVGNARQPGSYTVSSLSTLVNALFFSGGPSKQGSMRRIELRRDGKVVTTFDLYDLLIYGDKSHDAPLLPGDVIYIPPVGPQVAIAGSVHVPAIYELKGTETAGQAIVLAGGLSTMASKQEAQLDRTNQNGARLTVQIALDAAGMDTPLRDGDILRIPAMVQQFERTVILRGNVANPGRYRWTPGMRISDLIPDKDSLQTRGYWQRRIALGLPAPEYTPLILRVSSQSAKPIYAEFRIKLEGRRQRHVIYVTGTSIAGTQSEESDPTSRRAGRSSPDSDQENPARRGRLKSLRPIRLLLTPTRPLKPRRVRANSTPELRYFPPGDRFSEGQFPIKNEASSHRSKY